MSSTSTTPWLAGRLVPVNEMIESLRRGGHDLLDRALRVTRKHGVNAEGLMLESFTRGAAELIVRRARKWGAQLIVLGTTVAVEYGPNGPVPVLLVRSKPAAAHRRK